jgi:hypothetical protein
MQALKHYDAGQLAITYGALLLQGTADSGRCTLEFPEGFGHVVGTDGEVARFKINDETARVTVPVLQTAVANTTLMQMYLADRNAPKGLPLPFFAKDLNGDSVFTAPGAWIVGIPRTVYVQGIEAREWVFQCAAGIWFLGGNPNLLA